MKATLNIIIHWLKLSIIVLMLTWVISLSILHFASLHIEAYRTACEQFVSKIVHRPVQIGEIALGSHGLEPVARFYDVVIFNHDKTKKLFQAHELQVGIDLIGSLLKWQIKPGLLLVRGSKISVSQDQAGKISIRGIVDASGTTDTTKTMLTESSSWLFEQSRIDLENIYLKWHFADGSSLKFTNLYLKLYNGVLRHDLQVTGELEQKQSPAFFKADLKLSGDLLGPTMPPIVGDVILENWVHELNLQKSSDEQFFIPPSGDINLSVRHSQFIAKLFRQPILINEMSGHVVWQHDANGLKVNINKLEFMDDWLTFYGDSQFLFPLHTAMPTVDIKLGFKLANLAKAKLYYPITILPKEATAWLDQAFVKSKPILGNMILQGPLAKFPFDHNEGKFLVESNLRDVQLNYDPDWPQIEDINGKMVFANRSLKIEATSAKILHKPAKSIIATIPDLETPALKVIGAIDVDSSIGLNFVNSSPLKEQVGRKLQGISLMGPMKFDLNMDIPLSDEIVDQKTYVTGNIELDHNYLNSKDLNFGISDIKGKLHFSEDDLTADKISGKLFNRPIEFNIRTLNSPKKDIITQINIMGSARVTDFEQIFSFKLQPYMFGNFTYKASLELHSIVTQNIFRLKSDLRGVTVDLPKPFDKTATSGYKFDLSCYFGGNKTPQVLVNYNDQINVALMVKQDDHGLFQILAGEIKFGASPARVMATSGLIVTGKMARLDWSIWKSYLAKTTASFTEATAKIRQLNLNLAELHVLGQVFKQLSLQVRPQANGWNIAMQMPNIKGTIFFPNDRNEYLRGEFEKLYLRQEKSGLSKVNPGDLPPLHFTINDFRYGTNNFGKVKFITESQSGGLKINQITMNGSKFNIDGSGEWVAVGNNQSSVFRGKISSNDVGNLLRQWDLTNSLVGGSGSANFILKWPGAFYDPTLLTVSGAFALRINNGRIINLGRQTESKLGFGRVLSMLSLQTLPQRLSLNFSDLTKQGFGFNTMVGEVELAGGNARVQKLTLDGHAAHVKAYGRIGLKAKDYDLMLSAVMPQITSPMPVVGAIAGGPVGGVLGFIADRIISTELKKSANYNYHITGSWDNPSVSKP